MTIITEYTQTYNYIYVYLDTRKQGNYKYDNFLFKYEPFYVGKGQGNRRFNHLVEAYNHRDTNKHKCRIIRKIKQQTNNDPLIMIILENLSTLESNIKEIEIIDIIGRRNNKTGQLTNITAGGTGGDIQNRKGTSNIELYGKEKAQQIANKISESNKGKLRSNATKKKMSESRKGDKSYMFGIPKTTEIRRKISATRIKDGIASGENNPMYGKRHTDDAKKKMSESSKLLINDKKIQEMILANPNRRPVVCHNNKIFPSLRAAGRYYGFVGNTAPRARIKNGVWKYIN